MPTQAELHAEAMQHYAMAHHHLGKLKTVLDQMGSVQSGSLRVPVRCVREWQDWLAAHGPSLKTDITEQTGVRFTERGTPYTVEWIPSLASEPDDHFDPTTLMKISAPSDGRGRPPVIFFLWSQRFDVFPRFQVGPIRGETQSNEFVDGLRADRVVQNAHPENRGSLVSQPTDDHDGAPIKPWSDAELWTDRCTTMAEWDELHSAAFDAMVLTGTRASDEQKTLFRDTCPSGEDANAAIAIAYRNAVKRANEPMTGAVQPVSPHPISPGSGEEIPIDWDAP